MPRCFIHLENSLGILRDETGRDSAGAEAAYREAARTAGGLLTDELDAGHVGVTIRLNGARAGRIEVTASAQRPS